MKLHGNARTCPRSRRLLVERIDVDLEAGRARPPLTVGAARAGQPLRTRSAWRARPSRHQEARPLRPCRPSDARPRPRPLRDRRRLRVPARLRRRLQPRRLRRTAAREQGTTPRLPRACCRSLRQRGVTIERVLTDNGSCYRSAASPRAAPAAIVHTRTRPRRPQTNGKAERFIQTLLREWAYARLYEQQRTSLNTSRPGSTTTTTDDYTAASATSRPRRD